MKELYRILGLLVDQLDPVIKSADKNGYEKTCNVLCDYSNSLMLAGMLTRLPRKVIDDLESAVALICAVFPSVDFTPKDETS